MADKKRKAAIIAAVILGCAALLYLAGMLGQLLENYTAWMAADGFGGQTEMKSVDWNPFICIPQAFTISGLKGMLGILLVGGAIVLYVRLHDKFDGKTYDPRGFKTSSSGAYGTASWMEEKEMKEVLEVAAPAKAEGVILGEYKGNAVCMPKDTRLNRHIAIFGASGTMKSRAIIRNALFQALKRQESVVITDPKGELYADTAELYRQNGYEVKVFNLVNPEHGDSWNCMSDLNGDTLMAQVLTNVIIGNTSSGKGDHFWDNGEGNLLKSLILLIDQDRSRSPDMKHLPAVYQMLTQNSERQLTALFDKLPLDHPARAPFNLDQTYSYILNNTTQSSFIRVEKHDAETGKIIPAAGVGFQVRDLSTGDLIVETLYYPTPVTIDTFFTNEEGWLMLPYELPYGQYELIEVETCYGYVLDSEPVPFTVDGTEDVVVVEKHNMPQKGKIVVAKTGEVFASVTTADGADKDGADILYQPVYEIRGLEGATYEIRAAEDIYTPDGTLRAAKGDVVDTVTTGSGGVVSSKELYLGKYEIVEIKAPFGMVLNPKPQQVELVYAGQEVDLTETAAGVYNERQKVELSLVKTLELSEEFGIGSNNEMANITFGLYAAEDLTAADGSVIPADGLLEIVSLNAEGRGIAQTDLPLGSYYLREHSTEAHYLLSGAKYPVTFAYGDQDTVVVTIAANDGEPIVNELIYGSVSGKKLDENGKALGGAKIGLFAPSAKEFTEETAILVTTSAEDGSFQFENVPYGLWIVREISQPEGFVLCTDLFPVAVNEDGQVIEIEITNEFIRGNLHLTKFDKDYPENKLSGAVFEVYRDTNGNKELDKDDELLGTMEETEKGQYEMRDLLYGGVLVKEKTAPDGFYLDENVYYVMIDTDEKTYEIENEAGKGFYNEAHKGNLKIVKTSSDGRVEGFSFRVVGDNYDQTFKTDSNGEIFIENLRVGKYTVTEVEDSVSAGYKRPDPVMVELVVDETLTINVHNDKVTVDVPKTGDTSNLWLWVGLMALGAAGAGTTLFISRKKRKKTSR